MGPITPTEEPSQRCGSEGLLQRAEWPARRRTILSQSGWVFALAACSSPCNGHCGLINPPFKSAAEAQSLLKQFANIRPGRTTFALSPISQYLVVGVAKKACTSPVLICKAMPGDLSLIIDGPPHASIRCKGESAGIRVLRSVITPFCQR